jgi:TRAP-type C4-dicarboxylate transport system permease small subunit
MNIVRAIDRGITVLVTLLLVFAFTLMLALAASQVVLRQALHATLLWGDLAARQLVVWVGFLGAALASRKGGHFHIGFLARLVPPRVRPWLHAAADLAAAAVCVFLVRAGWTFVTVGLDPAAILFLGIHQATAALIIPGGFALMAVQFVLRAVESLGKGLRGHPDEEPA